MSVCILNKAPVRVNRSTAEEISQALCASALETQSQGRSQRGWEASAAVTCDYVTRERGFPPQDRTLAVQLSLHNSSFVQKAHPLSNVAALDLLLNALVSGPFGVRP